MLRKIKRTTSLILVILIAVYFLAINILASALLKPSFMDKLDSFETLTEKGYGEQVYTDDIVSNEQESKNELKEWLASTQWRKIAVMNDDGLKLVAAEFAQPEDSDWVLLLHGYTGWKEENYEFAKWYYEQGYSVIAADSRAHGQSEGDVIGMGYTDVNDNLLWIKYILSVNPEATIILHGQSMGASAALMLTASDKLPDNVAACIADSAFTSAYDLFAGKLDDWTGIPDFLVMPALNITVKLRFGYSLKEASALSAVSKSSIPTLFIHGSNDKIVPEEMSSRLFDSCSAQIKKRLLIEGAGHVQSMYKNPELYYKTISQFINNLQLKL